MQEYFKTGDRTILKLEDDNLEEYDDYYIEALIKIVKHYYKKKEKEQNTGNTARILKDDDDDNYMKYVFKYAYHILPLLIIFGIGFLSIFGWIICAVCACKKCSCCVCKVPKCKTPAAVLSLISYVVVALISFYALVEQNKIFSGLADIECAVLRFTDDFLEGETNKFPPYWAGIDKISSILTQFKTKTLGLSRNDIITPLSEQKATSDGAKSNFEDQLGTDSQSISSLCRSSSYQLDITKNFGDCRSVSTPPDNSVCNLWLKEYADIYLSADEKMDQVTGNFNTIKTSNAATYFENSIDKMEEIKTNFNSLKQLISDQIIEKADDIDKKGKLIYTLFFTFLMIFCAAIVVFMLLLCLCSGELCTN